MLDNSQAGSLAAETDHMSVDDGNAVDLSIIIVSWNAVALLRQCLASAFREIDFTTSEVLVLDNGSSDGSPEMVREEFPRVRLFSLKTNLGFAGANNIGLRECRGKYICLVNSDVVIVPDCLRSLYKYLDTHPTVGLIGPRILNPDETLQPSCFGFPGIWSSFVHAIGASKLFGRLRILRDYYQRYSPFDRTCSVDVLSGCFWLARRRAQEEVGPLDEGFFFSWEDFDWCRRYHESKWDVVYCIEGEAIHYGQGSSVNAQARFAVEVERSRLRYWEKYWGAAGKSYIAILIVIRHALQSAKFSLVYWLDSAERNNSRQNMMAHLAVVRWMLSMNREGPLLQP